MEKELLEMNRREREVLKVMSLVLNGQRTQVEAARLLKRSTRQVRRIVRQLQAKGDGGVIHGLRGRPSNHAHKRSIRQKATGLYRRHYGDFGPTLACEKLEQEHNVMLARETLRRWLVEEGLWHPKRRRDLHRARRERKACFGEMIQADGSEHDWLEGRGERMVLLAMIDDASNRILARFYPAETTGSYMDLLGRWLKAYGRPLSWYSDRDSVFRAESTMDREQSVPTQFSRALAELDIQLILANSPQAKGRVERLFGTLQDRWVKELRLAKVRSMQEANNLLESKLLNQFNARFAIPPASGNDAHRKLDKKQDLAVVLSIQEKRTVANDYTIRLDNEFYQLLPPVFPGQRGGKVIVEKRLDGSIKIRFKQRYLEYQKIRKGLAAPDGELASLTLEPIPAAEALPATEQKAKDRVGIAARSSAVHRTAGCSGRTPAEPYLSGSKSCGRAKHAWRPAPHHPWRNARLSPSGHS